MRAAETLASYPRRPPSDVDQRVFLRDVGWDAVGRILGARGDDPSVRVTYCEGLLELMSPSRTHEILKKSIARLLEVYLLESGTRLWATGSTTTRNRRARRAVEPDESYAHDPQARVPDLVIEVEWTSGGIDKLDVYRGLGVAEVWRWSRGRISVHLLEGARYVEAKRSRCLPELDIALLARFVAHPDQPDAVVAYRDALRAGRARPRRRSRRK